MTWEAHLAHRGKQSGSRELSTPKLLTWQSRYGKTWEDSKQAPRVSKPKSSKIIKNPKEIKRNEVISMNDVKSCEVISSRPQKRTFEVIGSFWGASGEGCRIRREGRHKLSRQIGMRTKLELSTITRQSLTGRSIFLNPINFQYIRTQQGVPVVYTALTLLQQ